MDNIANQSNGQKMGIKCPGCGEFIETSIVQLLVEGVLKCPVCHLRLTVDRQKSNKAFGVLQKIQNVQTNLEKTSKFSR